MRATYLIAKLTYLLRLFPRHEIADNTIFVILNATFNKHAISIR